MTATAPDSCEANNRGRWLDYVSLSRSTALLKSIVPEKHDSARNTVLGCIRLIKSRSRFESLGSIVPFLPLSRYPRVATLPMALLPPARLHACIGAQANIVLRHDQNDYQSRQFAGHNL